MSASKSKHRRQSGSSTEPPSLPPYTPAQPQYGEPQTVSIPKPAPAIKPTPTTQRQASLDLTRIGEILKRVREQRGEYIEDIAEYLRIRPPYLIALEESHYEELPADAYVIGFLRTYANYLGLDGRAAIDQYRKEMAGRRRKPLLSMPQPITEGQTPSATVLIGAVVAVLIIYLLWYSLSGSDRANIDQMPPLPQITSITTPKAGNENTTAPPSNNNVVTPPVGTTTLTTPAAAPQTTQPPAPTTVSPTTQPAINKTPTATNPVNTAGITIGNVAAAPQAPLPAVPNAQPQKAKERPPLIIRADQGSWVFIVDDKGRTIFDRVLKPGEAVKVPDQDGLKLTTGNAGGITLNLGGVDLPPLGDASKVIRGVDLDPEKLKN